MSWDVVEGRLNITFNLKIQQDLSIYKADRLPKQQRVTMTVLHAPIDYIYTACKIVALKYYLSHDISRPNLGSSASNNPSSTPAYQTSPVENPDTPPDY